MMWTEGWKGCVGDRQVTVLRNAGGDTRVSVVQASAGIGSPGFPIDIEPAEDETLVEALISEGGFTQAEAEEILHHT